MSKDRDIEASKLFLESERGFFATTSSSSSQRSPIQDLIKCFCGVCESWFKRKSIEYALKANGEEILRDQESREILIKFLKFRQGKSHFQSPAQKIVHCFEVSEDVLNGKRNLTEELDEVNEICYTEAWEERLTQAIENGITNDFFHDLMRESAIRLENDSQFVAFKEELKKKLK
ncbi:hypothetical protein PVAND_000394 [Polypedilum vanderplanki]|uniref:Uncharacterized protein n=1 Tax=Polypedilum vanderplanki TaxID=319348 RepID=A0A9J6BKH6_POLVA|nr:hypothetical protein PVAND_000394 [Polypedilum vanderplanki]